LLVGWPATRTLILSSGLLGISPYVQQAIIGAVIILVVWVDELRRRRMSR
jgi:ribose/xylose/arabinose/galactoside ABC-type transport system permease subunit